MNLTQAISFQTRTTMTRNLDSEMCGFWHIAHQPAASHVRFRGKKYSEPWAPLFRLHARSAKELVSALHSAGNNFSFSRLGHARQNLQEPEIVTKLPKMKKLLGEAQVSNLDTNS